MEPPGKKSNAEKAAPSTPVTGVELGKTGNIRAPHRVTTVTSDASGPHLLNLDNTAHCKTVQTAMGYAGASASVARSRDGRLTKTPNDLLEIIKPRLVHLLHRPQHRLNHGRHPSLPGQDWWYVALSSLTSLMGRALVYCPSESLCTSDVPLVFMPLNELLTMAGARGIPSLVARLGVGPR